MKWIQKIIRLRKKYSLFTKFAIGPAKSWSLSNFAQCIASLERHTFMEVKGLKQWILVWNMLGALGFDQSVDRNMFANFTKGIHSFFCLNDERIDFVTFNFGGNLIQTNFYHDWQKFFGWNWPDPVHWWWNYSFLWPWLFLCCCLCFYAIERKWPLINFDLCI